MALDQETINAQLELLAVHRRTLAVYLRQQAELGVLAPPGVFNGIYAARAEIIRIKTYLRENDLLVDDKLGDEAPHATPPAVGAGGREIEEQRAQDDALQAYFDQMTQLLLHEKLRTSQPYDEVRSLARARTLTVLRVLDSVRKATVLQFLYEAGLIGGIEQGENGSSEKIDAIVRLQGANLREVELCEANLCGVRLEGANLEGASLIEADLGGANLFEVDLGNAKLQWANLKGAYLIKTKLYGANLLGADLTDCIIDPIQLAQASSLEGAKLPFDIISPPAPKAEGAARDDPAHKKAPTAKS